MKPKMIIPMLVCRDAAAEIVFCERAFSAVILSRREAEDGRVMHATLRINGALIMVHDESPHLESRAPREDGSSPVVIYLYGEEVDAIIEKAVAAGARILLPAADQFWGDRVGRVVDPAGHVWNVAARIHAEEPKKGAPGERGPSSLPT
jgi:PhnB protein